MNSLSDQNFITDEEISALEDASVQPSANVKFTCPNCGEISQDDVIFLCNTCSQTEVVYEDGIYMCPSCLVPGENFECMNCGSKQVHMHKHDHDHSDAGSTVEEQAAVSEETENLSDE